jgi:hypothetical protein
MTDPAPTDAAPTEEASTETESAPPIETSAAAEPVIAHAELVDPEEASVAVAADDAGEERREAVEEPAKVMRIGSMIKQLLDEVRAADLDDAARDRLRSIYDTSVKELGAALSPDLRAELERVAIPFGDDDRPSDAELRIAQAQLVGWLEGLFHGIQATLFAQQMAARNQLDEIRQQLTAGGPAGPGGVGGPGGPGGPGGMLPSDDGSSRPGTYL